MCIRDRLKGVADYIEQDALEGYEALGTPMAVIDTLLMPAMERVGTLFGEGKMFLPQVVKTARVMKRAVAALTPYIEQGGAQTPHNAGKVLIATVKGDVHDIGKNIVAVVMACNGYEIKDLGVMVESQRIVDEAVAWGADCICLSGLITPSLDEMAHVCEELERRALRLPVIIGGATTSNLHTAVKIAPVYSGLVIHSPNASRNSQILAQLLGPDGDLYADKVKADQQALREEYARRLRERGRGVTAVVGFNTACEAFGIEALQAAGARTIVATADGSLGVGGLVTDAIAAAHPAYGYFYACGPLPMLRALCQTLPTPGEVSLEERMGCGFGACMGCTCQTAGGPRRICLEGPVFRKEEIRWNEIPK